MIKKTYVLIDDHIKHKRRESNVEIEDERENKEKKCCSCQTGGPLIACMA
jgi:hypothetical protein